MGVRQYAVAKKKVTHCSVCEPDRFSRERKSYLIGKREKGQLALAAHNVKRQHAAEISFTDALKWFEDFQSAAPADTVAKFSRANVNASVPSRPTLGLTHTLPGPPTPGSSVEPANIGEATDSEEDRVPLSVLTGRALFKPSS